MEKINLDNTYISFTPSFLGNGWETSLLPKLEREHAHTFEFKMHFSWLKKMLLKMQGGWATCLPAGRRWEVKSWTTAIVRLFFLNLAKKYE